MAQPDTQRQSGYTVAAHPSDIDRAIFLGSAATDNLHAALMVLAAELWSVRRRQKVVEALLADRGVVTAQAIESYVPSEAQEAAWHADRDDFIRLLYAPLERTGDLPYHASLHPAGEGR